jgi:hypothetical protein
MQNNRMMLPLGVLTALLLVPSAANADVFVTISPTNTKHVVNHSETFAAIYTIGNCEAATNDDVTFQWKVDGVPIQGATGPGFTYTPTTAGVHTISCTVDAGICGAGSASASETAVAVSFAPTSVRTGFTKPTNTIKPVSAVATVTPKSEASNVTITHTGADRVAILITKIDTTAGTISFTMTGTSATAANAPTGDETIVGQVVGENTGSMKVIVVVPTTVSQPAGTVSQNVTPVNMALSTTTVPSVSCPAGYVDLATEYNATPTTITVKDQFGKALDSIYAGVQVYEAYKQTNGSLGTYNNLNVYLSGSGTYSDIIGFSVFDSPAQQVLADSQAAKDWPTQPTLPVTTSQHFSESFSIQVGGFVLTPTLDRDYTFTPPNSLSIVLH